MGVNAKKLPESQMEREPCCSKLKMFLVSLSFVYFAKAFQGSYMKSSITQIERRFDIPSSLIGVIDGSFEMGNLLVIAFVSYFGAKLHRPRLIGAGCLLMALGSFCTALPHFFMGHYQYETSIEHSSNLTVNTSPCLANQSNTIKDTSSPDGPKAECEQEVGSSMWIYVFLGNMLRGIGETPIMPLGLSYLDDFSQEENTAFYIACLQTIFLLGPVFGFLLGSLCAKLYVDIGFVNLDSVTISPRDARWVGAWWLGFFVSSAIMLFAGIPFWFLPKSLPNPEEEKENAGKQEQAESESLQPQDVSGGNTSVKLVDIARGFLPSLKKLLGTPVYFVLVCGSILKFNSFIGLITFKPKYMEQQFGQSASGANFFIGLLNLPAVATGIFVGGLIMKKFKMSVVAGAQLSFATSFTAYLLSVTQFGIKCENIQVAGLTVSYNGTSQVSNEDRMLLSDCNRGCSCSLRGWDPVCSENEVTYMSPCLAGCKSSSGFGRNMVFHNCTCVASFPPPSGNLSVVVGQCPRKDECKRSFIVYMAVSVLSSFINALGITPGYMVIIRCIMPELKSLALGIQTLMIRTLGGIPAPVYFGALIDSTCLKWGIKKCGGRGACRMYNSNMYRHVFLGLIVSLSGLSYFFTIAEIVLLRKQFGKKRLKIRDTDNIRRAEMEFVNMDNKILSYENKLSDCQHKDTKAKDGVQGQSTDTENNTAP
uniref:Solute carrier organic anion transporter family member n=1 Tax=Lepisosteus oculatus TaxID=7918 RepID=W5NE99_LEPOC